MSFLKKVASTISIAVCTSCLAQSPVELAAKPSPNLAGIAHVAFRVADLDASLAFYHALGFEKPFELSRDGKVYEAFIKVNDRQFIELYPVSEKDSQAGFLHICFEDKDIAATRAFYLEHGLQPTEIAKGGAGNLLFSMVGPATPMGPQNIEYTEYMPGSMHSKDFGMHLGVSRISTELVSVSLPFDDPDLAKTLYLDHASFMKTANGTLAIPGGGGESISLASTQTQGFHGRITFAVADLAMAKSQLLAHKLHPVAKKRALELTDPDGNTMVFAPRR